jgi:large subunit ribosomal protein L23
MSIIIKPIITEKITKQSEISNRFGFVVDRRANKIQIKNAIEAAYGVSIVAINTMNVRPDRSTKYTKSGLISGKTAAYKKAIVQVQEGETIDFYNNISN